MYRGDLACDSHSLTPAVGCCRDCGRLLCEGCEVFAEMIPRCTGCARVYRKRRQIIEDTLGALMLLMGAFVSLSTGLVLGMSIGMSVYAPLLLP